MINKSKYLFLKYPTPLPPSDQIRRAGSYDRGKGKSPLERGVGVFAPPLKGRVGEGIFMFP
jgi:hypothetical protein